MALRVGYEVDSRLTQRVALVDGNGDPYPHAGRDGGVLHRNAITAVDKLATPSNPTLADRSADGGVLTANTAYYVNVAAYNRWGSTLAATAQTITTASDGNNAHVIRATIAQVTGADGYDIFLSTAAAPLWVGRVTEAQRASGIIISAVGTTTAGGAAGAVDVRVVGTGLASNVNPFLSNNAYTPASVTAINCAGRAKARILVKLAVTDLRSLPTLAIVPFFANQVSTADWHQGAIQTVPLLTGLGASQEQDFELNVDGSTGLVVLVDTISGQGSAASIWVELVP